MKKIFLLFIAFVSALTMNAKIGYVIVNNGDGGDCTECYAPWEGFWDGNENHEQSPERTPIIWFNEHYVAHSQEDYGEGQFIMMSDLASADLTGIDVLWLHISRPLDNINGELSDEEKQSAAKDQLKALLPDGAKEKLIGFIKDGGNVFLSGQATYFVRYIDRMNEDPNVIAYNDHYRSDQKKTWSVRMADPDPAHHALWRHLGTPENHTYGEDQHWYGYPILQWTQCYNDRNCLWNGDAINALSNHNAAILGYWGNDGDPQGAGFVEFYPKDDWKGTIIVNGLAAYQWSKNANIRLDNLKSLTRGILDYLSPKSYISWNALEKSSIRICEVFSGSLSLQNVPEGSTITYTSNNPLVANVGAEGDGVYGNHFGSTTFHAVVNGDGMHAPKSKIWEGNSAELTVNGGSAAQYAYVLPFSMHTMSNYDNEETYRPDFVSADWFNTTYLNNNTGCFLNPTLYSAENPIPSDIQVLWIHNDHVGQGSWEYYTALGGDNFTAALQAFINRGGCVFVSKQATRVIGDLGLLGTYEAESVTHKHYPSYNNGGYADNRGPWGLKNRFYDGAKDYSTHAVYAGLGENPTIMTQGTHTNNNCILFADENLTQEQVSAYEAEYNCRLLGSWNNDGTDYDGGVFAEFLPRAGAQGSIIMLGAAAYQWTGHDINDVDANIKTLTSNILSYLASDPNNTYTRDVPADHYGTICLPRASASLSDGMKVYRVLSDETDGIMLEEVNAMEAGVPYFFYSTANRISVTMTGAAVPTPQNGNGLIGNFGPASVEIPNETDNCILGSDNTLYYVDGTGIMLGANRAYLDRSTIGVVEPSGMPKRRIGIYTAPTVATGLDNTGSQSNQPTKKLIDGRLVIQFGNQVYDVTGAQVK